MKREKAVYHTLNKLSVDVTRKVLVAEAWVPRADKADVHAALRSAATRSNSVVSAPLFRELGLCACGQRSIQLHSCPELIMSHRHPTGHVIKRACSLTAN